MAKITKQKPKSMMGALRELASDADVYTVQFVVNMCPKSVEYSLVAQYT